MDIETCRTCKWCELIIGGWYDGCYVCRNPANSNGVDDWYGDVTDPDDEACDDYLEGRQTGMNDSWIPTEERMPEEHDSPFALFYGALELTPTWGDNALWLKQSDRVLVTAEFSTGRRAVYIMTTHDGKWAKDAGDDFNVIAWMPLPAPCGIGGLNEDSISG